MPNNDATGSKPADRADWNSAWEIVARLAAAREGTLHEVEPPRPPAAHTRASQPVANAPAPAEPVDPDQLARGRERYRRCKYTKRDDEAEMRKRVDPKWRRVLPRW